MILVLTAALAGSPTDGFRGFLPDLQPIPAEAPTTGCTKGTGKLGPSDIAWVCEVEVASTAATARYLAIGGKAVNVHVEPKIVDLDSCQALAEGLGALLGKASETARPSETSMVAVWGDSSGFVSFAINSGGCYFNWQTERALNAIVAAGKAEKTQGF